MKRLETYLKKTSDSIRVKDFTSMPIILNTRDRISEPFRRLIGGKREKPREKKKKNDKDSSKQNKTNILEDNRTVLFSLSRSEIAVYKCSQNSDMHEIIKMNKSSIVSKGKFEIYQINSLFNYLICGSITHPILPSCKIIKINTNAYVIPIQNPMRYWRLTLDTENELEISRFEAVVSPISKFSVELLPQYTFESPFNTTLDETSLATVVSQPTIFHPTPIRPNSTSSTSSISLLNQYNSDISSIVSIGKRTNSSKGSDNRALSEATELFFPPTEIDSDLDADLQLEADELNTQEFDTELTKDLLDEFLDIDEKDDLLKLWNEQADGITKRYSLSFKNYDTRKPLPLDIFDKYAHDQSFSDILKSNSSTGLLNKFLDSL